MLVNNIKVVLFSLFLEIFMFTVLIVLIIVNLYAASSTEKELNTLIEQRFTSFLLSDQLRQSSDDLTNMVRGYAATGDPKFEIYFNMIADIRDGKAPLPENYNRIFWDFRLAEEGIYEAHNGKHISILDLMEEAGITREEYNLLTEGKMKSDKLIELEQRAFSFVKERLVNTSGNITNYDMAIQLVFSDQYYQAKRDIMAPINKFMISVDQRTALMLSNAQIRRREQQRFLVILFTILIVLIPVFVGTIIIYYRLTKKDDLKRSEERLRFLITRPDQIMYSHDLQNNTTEWTGDIEGITGYSADFFMALNQRERENFIHDDDRYKTVELFEKALTECGKFETVYRFKCKNGEYKYIEDSGGIYVDRNNSEMIGVMKDITDKKIAELENSKLNEKLMQSQKMEAIGHLAGGIAHDFNNMLGGIIGSVQVLKRYNNDRDEKYKKYLSLIYDAALSTSRLTDKLVAFAGRSRIESEPLSIYRLISDTVAILETNIDKRISISVKKNFQNDTVIGDKTALQSLILNLSLNAISAMPNGGTLDITIDNKFIDSEECSKSQFDIVQGNYIELKFSDSGDGIPMEYLDRIFDPFFTTKEHGKGTGLGLSAVYGVVQDHKGAIKVKSALGIGTIFNVYLPSTSSSVKLEIEDDKELASGSGSILFVDDEWIIRETGSELLQEMGYDVIVCSNGKEAVDIYKEKFSDIKLVIMDMLMPVMSGKEAFLKMKEFNPECKVILVSGFTKDENVPALIEKGLIAFLHKPYRDYELSKIVKENI